MFGFSLPKLLFLIVLLVIVWYGFKLIERRNTRGRREEIEKAAEAAVRRTVKKRQSRERATSVDTAECTICKRFVPTRAPEPCERSDCPHASS